RRLRARRLRRLHRPPRRPRRAVMPRLRRPGRRLRGRHGRGPRGDGRAHRPPARVPRPPRAAVRLLHARRAHGDRGPARPRGAGRARRRRAAARRPGVPLHRLRADHRGDPRDGRETARAGVNLARTLLYAAERHPDAEAVVDDVERLTYAALQDRAARLATGLGDLGLGRGDRLAALLKNRAETVALYWACQWLGAWFVPLNHRLGPDEAAYCVEDAGAPVIAFDAAGADAARTLGADGG